MKIDTISTSLNFTANFKYTKILDECINHSSNKDLETFEKCIKDIKTFDDNINYSLGYAIKTDEKTFERSGVLLLTKDAPGGRGSRTIGEEPIDFWGRCGSKIFKSALKKAVSMIRADYNKANRLNKKDDIKTRIFNLLG